MCEVHGSSRIRQIIGHNRVPALNFHGTRSLVVELIVAIDLARVRFPASANFFQPPAVPPEAWVHPFCPSGRWLGKNPSQRPKFVSASRVLLPEVTDHGACLITNYFLHTVVRPEPSEQLRCSGCRARRLSDVRVQRACRGYSGLELQL